MNIKFTIAEILLLFLLTSSLFAQDFNYLSDYDNQGVPLDMVNTPVSTSLVDNINASLPENYPVPEYNPQYIADGVETNIILTELADVWVTFVGEGAGYKNVLGFYTYDAFSPPSSPPSDEEITIIFPNVSAAGSGGGLIVGDKMYLGQFPANTGIGWVLIANGWNGNQVTYGNWMLYSNPYFNPEGSYDLQKHNVNLYDDNEQVIVFGFEDIRRDFSSCDQDFNDALFLVTSNPYNAIETGDFNPISNDGGDQSSGNDGGLESHRGISSAIANRTYARSKKTINSNSKGSHIRSNTLLAEIVPASIKAGDQRSISSPTDLEPLTKAKQVWSADYTFDNKRFATVFATETDGGIYDHTKVVCDRLAGSEIIDIKEITILEQKFLLTSLKTTSGSIEYSISFSIELDSDENFWVFSKWAVDQYKKSGNFFNYQVWSAAPFSTIDITKRIIENLSSSYTQAVKEPESSYLPEIYVKHGVYKDNTIELTLMNTGLSTATVNIIGTLSTSETDNDLESYLNTIAVPVGEHLFILQNPNNELFDVELKIQKIESEQYDVAYFSDGAWGLDYDNTYTSINDYQVSSNTNQEESNYNISRDLSVEFDSEDYLSIYKHLKPSGRTVNLEEFNSFKFDAEFSKPLQIRLIKESIDTWDEQFNYVLNPSNDSKQHVIPFSYFRNKDGEKLNPEDIKMIVFTQEVSTGLDRKIELSHLQFSTIEESEAIAENLNNVFPNPTAGQIKLAFESPISESATVQIYDILGRLVFQEGIMINRGLNVIQKDFSEIAKGIHILRIEGRNSKILEEKVMFF